MKEKPHNFDWPGIVCYAVIVILALLGLPFNFPWAVGVAILGKAIWRILY